MPTGSVPIAPTALSVPLHSYGMLAYQHGIADFEFRIVRSPRVSKGFLPSLTVGLLTLKFAIRNSAFRNFGTWFKPRCIVGAGLLDQ